MGNNNIIFSNQTPLFHKPGGPLDITNTIPDKRNLIIQDCDKGYGWGKGLALIACSWFDDYVSGFGGQRIGHKTVTPLRAVSRKDFRGVHWNEAPKSPRTGRWKRRRQWNWEECPLLSWLWVWEGVVSSPNGFRSTAPAANAFLICFEKVSGEEKSHFNCTDMLKYCSTFSRWAFWGWCHKPSIKYGPDTAW